MMSKSGEMSDEVTKKSDNFSSYKLLEVTLHSYTFTFRRLNEKYEYNISTGCPIILSPLCFLLFCRLLLYRNTKFWWVLKNSGNLLSDRHQNFKNWFRNSWDNWRQRWHLSFRSWHFTIPQRQKNNFGVVGVNFNVNYLSYF